MIRFCSVLGEALRVVVVEFGFGFGFEFKLEKKGGEEEEEEGGGRVEGAVVFLQLRD